MARTGLEWSHRNTVIAVALVACACAAACAYRASQQSPFDTALWCFGDLPPIASQEPRLGMAKELVEQRILIGKSEQEIETMLGPPAAAQRFERSNRAYWLSRQRLGAGSLWLAIRFEAGKVVEAVIVEG